MARTWYAYTGGSVNLPSSYDVMSVTPACINGTNLCAIYAFNGGPNPSNISANLRVYITNALATALAWPLVPGAKKYVYMKYL